jgi:hypothetical protein
MNTKIRTHFNHTYTIDELTIQHLNEVSEKSGIAKSALIGQALNEYLPKVDKRYTKLEQFHKVTDAVAEVMLQ